MAEPTRDLDALREEEKKEDAALLADSEIERILQAFKINAYDVLDLVPGVPPEDIKRTYRRKSLLIHPDKSSNPNAQDAFDRLAQAYQALLDDDKRAKLDEAIADARSLLIRELKLTKDSEEVKNPDTDFMKAWKEKVKFVLADNEMRKRRQMKAQMQEEGREQRKVEEAAAERKRKIDHDKHWEDTREERIGAWRDFQKKGPKATGTKKKKIKVLG
ncbi:hypothetical protein AMS68_004880 [Peltaster fructicola]|uniref:J domain-containing protein n=1 Tax=Peltaster fructicola TaxID=286661 RepID=A0A6H0XX83_9PEZI|nr:hypothetical protein AMS68_004880 [Peltaster fructicola]